MAADTLGSPGFFEKHRDKIAFAGPDECWLWTAGKFNHGYGSVKVSRNSRQAHRVAYEAQNGVGSAEGLVVRHRCDTPLCVNPNHLLIGTVADNNRDAHERQRHAKGSSHGNSKLTEGDVRTIRDAYVFRCPVNGLTALGRRFGVAPRLVGLVVERKRWAHVR